jgi:hypothetical protein
MKRVQPPGLHQFLVPVARLYCYVWSCGSRQRWGCSLLTWHAGDGAAGCDVRVEMSLYLGLINLNLNFPWGRVK